MPRRDYAMELASRINPAVPSEVATLARDLGTSPKRVRDAVRELTEYGIHVAMPDRHTLTIDRDNYARAELLALTYDDPAPVGPFGSGRRR